MNDNEKKLARAYVTEHKYRILHHVGHGVWLMLENVRVVYNDNDTDPISDKIRRIERGIYKGSAIWDSDTYVCNMQREPSISDDEKYGVIGNLRICLGWDIIVWNAIAHEDPDISKISSLTIATIKRLLAMPEPKDDDEKNELKKATKSAFNEFEQLFNRLMFNS